MLSYYHQPASSQVRAIIYTYLIVSRVCILALHLTLDLLHTEVAL